MGYPMTIQRVIKRSGLQDGNYGTPPERHARRVITDPTQGTSMTLEETKIGRHDHLAQRVVEYEKAFMLLAGDLRRLEADAVDENGICKQIGYKTGIDEDVIAAVLKEFMAT